MYFFIKTVCKLGTILSGGLMHSKEYLDQKELDS